MNGLIIIWASFLIVEIYIGERIIYFHVREID